jgi:hypothetical protein
VVNSQSSSAFSTPSTPSALAALATAIFPTARASCGFSWNYTPSSPFMNSSGDYRFQYVEHLADADISRSAKQTDTFRSIKRADGSTKNLSFSLSSISAGNIPFRWNTKDDFCYEGDKKKFAFRKIRGINCLQTTFENGTTTLHGKDLKRGIVINQERDGPIEVEEFFSTNSPELSRPRKVYHIDKWGREELVRQHWLDENGNEIRFFSKTPIGSFMYERDGNSLTAFNAQNKQLLWRKVFDASGKILSFQYGEKTYTFAEDKTKKGFVVITQTSPNGTIEKSVPEPIFRHYVEKL